MMSGIQGKGTKPELIVRRLLFVSGYRFRLHRRDLPGSPDIVMPGRRVAIFVHGCFWHSHQDCKTGLPNRRLTGAEGKPYRLRGEAMKSEMIWPICLASSGGTALPIWPYCSVRFPSKK